MHRAAHAYVYAYVARADVVEVAACIERKVRVAREPDCLCASAEPILPNNRRQLAALADAGAVADEEACAAAVLQLPLMLLQRVDDALQLCMYMCMHMCMCVHAYVCMHVCACMCVNACVCVMYVYVCVCMCMLLQRIHDALHLHARQHPFASMQM